MNENILKTRCTRMIEELGIAKTKFADNIGIGRSTYYAWQSGNLNLSETQLTKINNYLNKYGF